MAILVSVRRWTSVGSLRGRKCPVMVHALDAEMGVSKNRGKTPEMDGENNGKPY